MSYQENFACTIYTVIKLCIYPAIIHYCVKWKEYRLLSLRTEKGTKNVVVEEGITIFGNFGLANVFMCVHQNEYIF